MADRPADPWSSVASALGRDEPTEATDPPPADPSSPWARVADGLHRAEENDRPPEPWGRVATGLGRPQPQPETEPEAEPEPAVVPEGTGGGGGGEVGQGRPAAGRKRSHRLLGAITGGVLVVVLVVIGLVVWPGVGGSSNVAMRIYGRDVTKAQVAESVTILNKYYGYQLPAASDKTAYRALLANAAKAYAIDQIVLRQSAAMGITVSATDIDHGVSTADLDALAAARGLTLAQVQDQLRLNALESKLLQKVGGTANPSQAEISQTFTANQAALAKPETRTISRILVSSLSTAQSLITDLQQGQSFATLAGQDSLDTSSKSSGGLIGTVPESEISSTAFAQAAFAAQVNVPFGPVSEGANGEYDVGLVSAITPASPATLDATTQGVIKQWLVDKVQNGRWEAWLRRQLVAAKVTYHPPYKPSDPLSPPSYPVPSLSSLMASAVSQTPSGTS